MICMHGPTSTLFSHHVVYIFLRFLFFVCLSLAFSIGFQHPLSFRNVNSTVTQRCCFVFRFRLLHWVGDRFDLFIVLFRVYVDLSSLVTLACAGSPGSEEEGPRASFRLLFCFGRIWAQPFCWALAFSWISISTPVLNGVLNFRSKRQNV